MVVTFKEGNRRFRIKLAPFPPGTSSTDSCQDLVSVLAPLIPIKEMGGASGSAVSDSQTCLEDSQMTQSCDQSHGLVASAQTNTESEVQTAGMGTGIRCAMPATATGAKSTQQLAQV